MRSAYKGLILSVARTVVAPFERARDVAIVRRVSDGALYFVRSCDRLALRLAIVSLWGDSGAFK